MGTRGFLGFVADGHETIIYNHCDSYPDGLGAAVLAYAKSVSDWAEVRTKAAAIVHVSDDLPPTDEQIAELDRYMNRSVGERRDRPDWYQLLRETQGDPSAVLEAGYAEHDPDWPGNSLFCEWGYLLDLDSESLEVYAVFQSGSQPQGRFGNRAKAHDGYGPVRLVASWSLHSLPEMDAFISKVDPEDDDV